MFNERYQLSDWGTTLYSKADGTSPAAGMGTNVTPGNNGYGSYASLISGAALSCDCLELTVCINNVGVSGLARDCAVSIGIDPAGGSSFTGIPGADLVAGPANLYAGTGGTFYKLPFWIKAGTSIGAAAMVNSATLTAVSVFVRVRGRNSSPNLYVGSYIDSFGVVLAATSAGTAVTSGGASEGAYTQLGSALTRPIAAWEFGLGLNNAAISNNIIDVDIAVGTSGNPRIVIPNATVYTNTAEAIGKPAALSPGIGSVGELVFGRCQTGNNAPNTGISLAAYGIGG
jgi:hypothetical protein